MMRIAFCLSGQMRTWRKCADTWLKFADIIGDKFNAQVDFFSHTWEFNTKPHTLITEHGEWQRMVPDYVSQEEFQEYRDRLKLVAFDCDSHSVSTSRPSHLERTSTTANYFDPGNTPLLWAGSQFYSLMKSAHLKKQHELNTGQTYDIVFRLRNDLYFNDHEINMFCQRFVRPQHNYVYSCHTGPVNTASGFIAGNSTFRLGDIFFYANSVTYDRLCDFYRWMQHIGPRAFSNSKNVSTETTLYYYAKMLRMNIKPIEIDPKICRPEYYVDMKAKLGLPGGLGGHEII